MKLSSRLNGQLLVQEVGVSEDILLFCSLFVCLFCFGLFRATPTACGRSQARGQIESVVARPTPQPQQTQIRAVSVTYTTAQGNAGSLTH